MKNFLFAHFTGEQENGEQIYFSVSRNGREYKDLNDKQPVLVSTIGEKGVRDPFLIRDDRNERFFIIATDLSIGKGTEWEYAIKYGSTNMVVWESKDLVCWSEPRLIKVDLPGAGDVWAPEAIFDDEKNAFLVFWSSLTEGKHKIYAAYTTDFYELGKPFLWLERKLDVIDTTVFKTAEFYYRFSKDEVNSRIIMERSQDLLGHYQEIESQTLSKLSGVEGPEIFQVEKDKWYLIVDRFALDKGYMILETNKLGETDFRVLNDTEFNFDQLKKRHGSVLPITDEEYDRLLKYYEHKNSNIEGS